jgi:hypothetical protein
MSGSRASRTAALIAATISNVDFIRLWSCMALWPGLPLPYNRPFHFCHHSDVRRVGFAPMFVRNLAPEKSRLAGITAFPCRAAFIMEPGSHALT